MYEGSSCWTVSSSLGIIILFNFRHSNRHAVTSHCGFNLHFPNDQYMEKAMATHSSTLGLENPMDRGDWWAAVHGVARNQTWLSDFTFTFPFHALEKEMATHSSILAWRIPGMGEPGGLLSVGLHRVGHDWSNLAAAAAAMTNIERFALETNRDHSVVFEVASKYCIWDSLLTMMATPFLLRDSCPQ